MELNLTLHAGAAAKPAIILIHGFGVNKYFWEAPEKCLVFGGFFPLTVFLSRSPVDNHNSIITTGLPDSNLKGLFARLVDAGYSIASWSQKQPLGPIFDAVQELEYIIQTTQERWPDKPIILIGHSRGGLIAKKFLIDHDRTDIKQLITVGTPHEGSTLAGFTEYLRPVAHILEKIVPNDSQSKMMAAVSRLTSYLKSPATIELMPRSELIESVKGPLPERIKQFSFGGTDPSLFKLYVRSLAGGPWNVFPFPDLLVSAIPSNRLPDEIKPGLGDALVTAQSAVLEGAEHHNIQANHVGLAYDKEVQDTILEYLKV